KTLVMELPSLEIDPSVTGFHAAEIDAMLLDHEDQTADPQDDFERPEAGSSVTTVRGDLWLLGGHRLLCGDARDPRAYRRLMQGRQADMAINDPPWNVRVDGHVGGRGKVHHDEFAFASGEMTDREYRQFLFVSVRRILTACKDGALIFVFIDWRHIE